MGDSYRLHPQMLALMRMQSDAILEAKPWLRGPYKPAPDPVPVEVAVEVPAVEPARRLVDVAVEWLERALVPDGLPSVEAAQRAVEAGITPSTLKRAAKALGVRKVKNGRAEWWWKLPEKEGE